MVQIKYTLLHIMFHIKNIDAFQPTFAPDELSAAMDLVDPMAATALARARAILLLPRRVMEAIIVFIGMRKNEKKI